MEKSSLLSSKPELQGIVAINPGPCGKPMATSPKLRSQPFIQESWFGQCLPGKNTDCETFYRTCNKRGKWSCKISCGTLAWKISNTLRPNWCFLKTHNVSTRTYDYRKWFNKTGNRNSRNQKTIRIVPNKGPNREMGTQIARVIFTTRSSTQRVS